MIFAQPLLYALFASVTLTSSPITCKSLFKDQTALSSQNNHEEEGIQCNHDTFKLKKSMESVSSSFKIAGLILPIITAIALPIPVTQSSSSLAIAAEFDEFFDSKYQDPRKVKARQELNKLKTFQDDRLKLCEDKGIDWEQCFLFGEFPTLETRSSSKESSNRSFIGNERENTLSDDESKKPMRPPTW